VFAATVGAAKPAIGHAPTVGWTSTNYGAPATSNIESIFSQGFLIHS
jgi:hypothetical protein